MKEKPNLLLLHGALGGQSQFNNLKKLLLPYFRVHTFNFSGHGNNSTDQEFSMKLFREDILRFMDGNSLSSTAIFGYSMGGYVGLKLALDHPKKVSRLMTLGTKSNWNPETAEQEVRLLNPEKMSEKIPQFVASLKKEHGAQNWKTVVHKTAKMMHALGNGKAMDRSGFQKITTEVLVCRGSEDTMVGRKEAAELTDNLPHGNFLEIAGCKHPIGQVDQQRLSEIMAAYFL